MAMKGVSSELEQRRKQHQRPSRRGGEKQTKQTTILISFAVGKRRETDKKKTKRVNYAVS